MKNIFLLHSLIWSVHPVRSNSFIRFPLNEIPLSPVTRSDVFGPTIKSENIPGTPMESIDALLASESIEMGSISDSSLIHDASLSISNQKSHMSHRSSSKTMAKDNSDDNNTSHTTSDSLASSQLINNERGINQRPSITSIDRSKRPNNAEVYINYY